MENKRTILLTGASGFLGSRILSKIDESYIVYLLTNKNKIKNLKSNHIQIGRNELDKIDNLDTVIHCAGKMRGTAKKIWSVNYNLTKILLNLSIKHNAFFLFFSTLNAGLNYKGHYENSKYEAEKKIFHGSKNFLIVRPSYLFDTDCQPNLIFFNRFFFIFKYLPILFIPPSNFLVQPLHIDDLLWFCILRIEKKDYKGKIIEVAGPHNIGIWVLIKQYFVSNGINIKFIKLSKLFFTPLRFCFRNKMNILFQDRTLKKNKEIIGFIIDGNRISKI